MLISHQVGLLRIVSGTWKHFVFNLLTCVFAYYINEFYFSKFFELPALVPTVLGTALAFFIAFNNNQAYDRWWEARKIWGMLVNDSRSWARQIIGAFEQKEEAQKFIYRHLAFLYALKKNMRNEKEFEGPQYLSNQEIDLVLKSTNPANSILLIQTKNLNLLYQSNKIDGFQFEQLNYLLNNFSDHMGKSERIKNTVFPTTYNFYTSIFVWFFIVCSTAYLGNHAGPWAILLGTLIGYVFLTTQKIGQTLLDPFEPIPTGVPINQISRTIEINLLEMLGKSPLPPPIDSINNEYVL